MKQIRSDPKLNSDGGVSALLPIKRARHYSSSHTGCFALLMQIESSGLSLHVRHQPRLLRSGIEDFLSALFSIQKL